MAGLPEWCRLAEFGIDPADVVRLMLKCEPGDVSRRVLITPCWPAGHMFGDDAGVVEVGKDTVYRLEVDGVVFTMVRSGIGAPQTGDVVLALGCTPCTDLVFTGSVGGLHADLEIGDLIAVAQSVSGEGFSRYLHDETVPGDRLLERAEPDPELTAVVAEAATDVCERDGVALHTGSVYSIDTIVAQFSRVGYLAEALGCLGIEMETSAVFNAARLVGIRAAALLWVSDVIPARKSLFAGRTEEERARGRVVRRTTLREAITRAFARVSA